MTSQAARLPLPILPETQVDGKRLIDARLPVDNWQGVELCYNAAVACLPRRWQAVLEPSALEILT